MQLFRLIVAALLISTALTLFYCAVWWLANSSGPSCSVALVALWPMSPIGTKRRLEGRQRMSALPGYFRRQLGSD
jgi:hypothetical protein